MRWNFRVFLVCLFFFNVFTQITIKICLKLSDFFENRILYFQKCFDIWKGARTSKDNIS